MDTTQDSQSVTVNAQDLPLVLTIDKINGHLVGLLNSGSDGQAYQLAVQYMDQIRQPLDAFRKEYGVDSQASQTVSGQVSNTLNSVAERYFQTGPEISSPKKLIEMFQYAAELCPDPEQKDFILKSAESAKITARFECAPELEPLYAQLKPIVYFGYNRDIYLSDNKRLLEEGIAILNKIKEAGGITETYLYWSDILAWQSIKYMSYSLNAYKPAENITDQAEWTQAAINYRSALNRAYDICCMIDTMDHNPEFVQTKFHPFRQNVAEARDSLSDEALSAANEGGRKRFRINFFSVLQIILLGWFLFICFKKCAG